MLKYDSTHGAFNGTIKVMDESTLEINGKNVVVTSKRYCNYTITIFLSKYCLFTCTYMLVIV